ncbi:MAG: PQQ-dependent sugar dehydrogenase [Betaproteobacteria bacterium]|nr:PQQ-dependent sugar dehydrogenase [Betaproteobacteria bacterium]
MPRLLGTIGVDQYLHGLTQCMINDTVIHMNRTESRPTAFGRRLNHAYRVALFASAFAPCWQGIQAQTIPPGFTATRLFATTTLNSPTGVAFVPDGRMLVALQDGDLRVAQAGAVIGTPAMSLGTKVCSTSERGLLGVAVDPQFAANNFIYVFYTFRKFPGPAPARPDNRQARPTRSIACRGSYCRHRTSSIQCPR